MLLILKIKNGTAKKCCVMHLYDKQGCEFLVKNMLELKIKF